MSRDWPATFTTENQSVDPKPSLLVEVTTGLAAPNDTIRMTNEDADRSWSGSTFTARPFEFGDFDIEGGRAAEVELKVADVDGYWATWLASTDFRWQRVRRYRIDRDAVSATSHAQLDTFRVLAYSRTDRELTFSVGPTAAVLEEMHIPGRFMTRVDFPGMPTEGMVS